MITPRDFLGRHHVPEVPFSIHELGRRPVLLDPAAAKDQDSVHSGEHRSAVRHNKGRRPREICSSPCLTASSVRKSRLAVASSSI